MTDTTRTPSKTWSEKIKEAAAQARELRKKEIDGALERGDAEEHERLLAAEEERKNGRKLAKKKAKEEKLAAKIRAPRAGTKVWADNETARDWRAGKRSGGRRKNSAGWNLTPGAMVRIVSKARVYTESSWVMAKVIPKGSIGILIDAPPADLHGHVAVMFGADIFRIECKKLRMIHDDD